MFHPKRIVPDRKTNDHPAERKSVTGFPPLMSETDSIRYREKGGGEKRKRTGARPADV
jgi:hypothetical protein